MVRKKLSAGQPGSHAPKGLRPDQVEQIRHMRGDGHTLKAIAEKFGVSQSLVSRICNGYAHGPLEAR
jgi:transposase